MPSPAMASCDGMYDIPPPTTATTATTAHALRVLSIDVGMKNLAYCLFELTPDAGEIKTPGSIMSHINIVAWDTVNLCDDGATNAKPAATTPCCRDGCKFAAKFMHSPLDAAASYYCTRHANASGHKMPLPPCIASPKTLKKMTLDELKAFSGEYLSIPIPEKCEKSKLKLLQHLTGALSAEYLVAVCAKPKVISAAALDLITIGRNMHRQFDALPHIATGIDVVIIENQLSTLATRMKTLQGMITQYFIMRGVPDIRFISATNKLKLFSKEGEDKDTKDKDTKDKDNKDKDKEVKDDYADRKKRSIEITRSLILITASTASTASPLSVKFETHKKKDDLADCFLQGVWWLCKGV